jgi:uracil-DNA glycosylase
MAQARSLPTIPRREVPALFPARGPVRVILFGEAPGPRGAAWSGVPFWGDRSGRPVWRALEAAGLARVPEEAWSAWDGRTLAERALFPSLRGAALSNALATCPSDDGRHFRAPKSAELRAPSNRARITRELDRAAARAGGPLRVVALGGRAKLALEPLCANASAILLHALPHPSAQGLLSTAPDHGKGLALAALEAEWVKRLVELLG